MFSNCHDMDSIKSKQMLVSTGSILKIFNWHGMNINQFKQVLAQSETETTLTVIYIYMH